MTVTLRDLDSGDERGPGALRGRRGRQPQPDAQAAGDRHARLRELSRSITIYFRADCAELLRDRNQGVIYVHNPELRGFFRLDRPAATGFLVINTVGADVTQDSAVDVQAGLTEERALEFLRTAIGTDLPMEIVDDRPLAGRGELRRAAPRGPRVPGGRRRARRAAQRRLRRQHRGPGRAQPRLEARRGRQGRGRAGLLDTYEAERLPLSG